jgi:hypothetical protein
MYSSSFNLGYLESLPFYSGLKMLHLEPSPSSLKAIEIIYVRLNPIGPLSPSLRLTGFTPGSVRVE